MKNLINSISISRSMQVLKWLVISNRKKLLRGNLALCGIFLAFVIVTSGMLWNYEPMVFYRIQSAPYVFLFGFVGVLIKGALSVCDNMKTKTEKLSMLMLPATKVEKYLANVVFGNIITPLAGALALIAADLLQMLISTIMCGNSISIIFGEFSSMIVRNFFQQEGTAIAAWIAFYFLAHSTLLLGGTFFTKRQFVLTMLTVTFVPIVFFTIVALIVTYIIEHLREGNYVLSIEFTLGETATEWILIACMVAWTMLNYWGSYVFYRRIQIINNKFFN